ncbi:hypothetical protein ACIA8N_16625 [Streptomyces sp. NPDC051822]|uniref:hypothetical protein n=1 Tax=Streptomyces sp. NPDC051822 TaxID=3365675 RepID=UPI0037A9C9E2
MAQVSGSALAAVIAAKLASTLGVYGTIVGAGVISVIATCGGPLFQHLFRRTGEQVRDATSAARPKTRQVPVAAGSGDDRTLMLGTIQAPLPYDGDFGTATTHGTRVRGWKRPAIAAALVFGVTMGGITAYELVSGQDFSGRQGTTTFGSVVSGSGSGSGSGSAGHDAPVEDKGPAPAPSGSAEGTARPEDGAGSPSTGATPPQGEQGTGRYGTATPSQEPTPSGSTGGESTPTPTLEPTDPTAPAPPPTESGAPETPAPTPPADTGTE